MKTLPDESVHCVVTSPPYFGLRDFGVPPSIWGGDPNCRHEFQCERLDTEVGRGNWSQGTNGRGEIQPGSVDAKREPLRAVSERGFCSRCGAWSGAPAADAVRHGQGFKNAWGPKLVEPCILAGTSAKGAGARTNDRTLCRPHGRGVSRSTKSAS
jgi:hypothetical protein